MRPERPQLKRSVSLASQPGMAPGCDIRRRLLAEIGRAPYNEVMGRNRLDQIFRLSVAERVQLAEDLWDSVASSPEKIATTDAQRKELDRRLQAHEKDPLTALPGEKVISRVNNSRGASVFFFVS